MVSKHDMINTVLQLDVYATCAANIRERLSTDFLCPPAYLSGKGAVYGAPDWQAEWNSAR